MAIDKDFYNEASAVKLGWNPDWFLPGHHLFDAKLVKAIKSFQRDHDLLADGMCGPTTYRRLVAKMEAEYPFVGPPWVPTETSHLWYNGEPVDIHWPADKVHTFRDEGFPFDISEGFSKYNKPRKIKSFVAHWDVCLSSQSCAKVLKKRNVSVHFCIDNNGDIIQLHDMNDATWHAGVSKVNHSSVGVEISNAYYPKYQGWYEKNGFGARPVVTDAYVNGKRLGEHLGFYDVQMEALGALMQSMHEAFDIPYIVPEQWDYYSAETRSGKWTGFMNHFNCSKKKIDCGGYNLADHFKEK